MPLLHSSHATLHEQLVYLVPNTSVVARGVDREREKVRADSVEEAEIARDDCSDEAAGGYDEESLLDSSSQQHCRFRPECGEDSASSVRVVGNNKDKQNDDDGTGVHSSAYITTSTASSFLSTTTESIRLQETTNNTNTANSIIIIVITRSGVFILWKV